MVRGVRGRATRVRPVQVRTLADLADRNHLYAHCNHCRNAKKLDVAALLARFGPLSFGRLKNRLRCTRCGARRPELMHVWDNGAGAASDPTDG
jgi:hypothetical protein